MEIRWASLAPLRAAPGRELESGVEPERAWVVVKVVVPALAVVETLVGEIWAWAAVGPSSR